MPLTLVAMIVSYIIYQFAEEENKDTMNQLVSKDLIYKTLLPPIVLAEGFNMRQRTLGKYGREIATFGIFHPILTITILTVVIYSATTLFPFISDSNGFNQELE